MALNIIECLLQLGVVPNVMKKVSKSDDKEVERPKDGVGQSVGGAQGEMAGGTGAAPNGGGGGDGGGGGGGESRGGSRDDIKNNKDNKVCVIIHVLFALFLLMIFYFEVFFCVLFYCIPVDPSQSKT